MIGLYTKAILAAFIGAGGAATTALQDGLITPVEWVAIVITLVVGAGAVFAVPNVPDSVRVYGKAIVAGLVAGLGSLGTAMTDGAVTSAEVIALVTALVVGSGLVSIAPNAESSDVIYDYDPADLPDDEEAHGDLEDGPAVDDTVQVPRV